MVDNAITRAGAVDAVRNLEVALLRVSQSQPPPLIIVEVGDDEMLLECPWCGVQTDRSEEFAAFRYKKSEYTSNLIDHDARTLDFGYLQDTETVAVIVIHVCGKPVAVPERWQQYWSK